MKPYDLMNVALIVKQMRENSLNWHNSKQDEQMRLSQKNKMLAGRLEIEYGLSVFYNPDGGTWHVGSVDGPILYDLY